MTRAFSATGRIGAGALILLSLGVALGCQKKRQAPTPEVYVLPSTQRDVPVVMELVGQTAGSLDVEIRARVEGYLESVHYTEGQPVKKGDLLFTIESKTFQSVVSQRRADVASAEARLNLADLEVNRLRPLAEQQAVSRQTFDSALSMQKTSRAAVDAAKAALDKALLDLSYTRITAPTSGLADFAKVKPGNLVGRGDSTLLTTVSNVDPIHVIVGMQEGDYLKLAEHSRGGNRPMEGKDAPGAELLLSDGSLYPRKGRFDAVQRGIDPRTGTISVRAVFPNPDHQLRPGQFVKVRFNYETLKDAVLVPQRAVQEVQGAYQVAVVEGGKVQLRPVKMGPRQGEDWVVSEGLKPNEIVVVEGLQQIKQGAAVTTKPFVKAGRN
ncbi:efflux RND transporter periplasmic adaptor subunit [Geothrix oryzisoli]|uniref:efflux RND transporter periplasmic adaptor subunit n=1 Tax=Geothrix oryzisoli TaxID=2922721 RepID=UPI001FAE64F1|nr:efflux RND transporter periplasmic adaptor subunit [Geothrix oryzisoli]